MLVRLVGAGVTQVELESLRTTGPMLAPIGQLGMTPDGEEVDKRKLGKAERHWYLRALEKDLDHRARQLPPDDFRCRSYSGGDNYSAEIMGMPTAEVRLTSREHSEAVCAYMGLPSPVAVSVLGQPIQRVGNRGELTVDLYGDTLTTLGWGRGDDRRLQRHNTVEKALARSARAAGQHVVNGYDDTSRLIFTHLPEGETRTAIMQLRSTDPNIKGSIPDLGITLEADQTLARVSGPAVVLGELKSSSSKHETVGEREGRIQGDYERSAKKLDEKHYSQVAAPGPFASALSQYPRVHGVVFGAFGELSSGGKKFVKLIAGRAAQSWEANTGLDASGGAAGAIAARLKKRIALTIAKANAGEKIRGAEYVRTGRMPKHEETAGLFSGFGGSGGRDRADADRRSMAGPGRSFRAAAG